MSEITFDQLTDGQREAFNATFEVLQHQGQHITINGPAGTGKTTLTKMLIQKLRDDGIKGIMLAAPTHAAKKVLSQHAGFEASTIHSLLKINPNTYEDQSVFEQSDVPDLSECRVLICDEASMYDSKLFQILMASVPKWCTIIALGDVYQIRPVAPGSNESEISLFFQNPKFRQVSLTEVKRSNAPIIEVATEIRNGGWIRECLIDGAGVHDLSKTDGSRVANFMHQYFDIVKTPEDLMHTRVLAYTNASVNTLNKIIRQRIYGTEVPFVLDEVIVLQEPLMKSVTFEGKTFTEIVFNNGEMVRITALSNISKTISIPTINETQDINCWELAVESVEEPQITAKLTVIECEKELFKFQNYMGNVAGQFKNAAGGKRPNWKAWWKMKNSFTKVKALPVGTIHKSQGSSVDNVFLYTPCIHKADVSLAQQLLYVGATRARNNVYFI